MNLSSFVGIVAALAVFIGALWTSTQSREIFLNSHSILIVFGGTLAASLICFPLKTYAKLFKVFFSRFLGKASDRHEKVIQEIVEISKVYREGTAALQNKIPNVQNPFLREALELLVQGGIPPHEMDEILEERASTHFERYEEDSGIFKTIAKFPPAFGLMGTTLGMIALMQSLGTEDAYKSIGPAMAIGLVATLYGIAITNFIFIPIGENLGKFNKEDKIMRSMVIKGMQKIREKAHPLVVEEHLKSFLLPSERPLRKGA